MTKVTGEEELWKLEMTPSIREHFGVAAGQNIFRLSCVFRSADGAVKGTQDAGDLGWGTVTSNLGDPRTWGAGKRLRICDRRLQQLGSAGGLVVTQGAWFFDTDSIDLVVVGNFGTDDGALSGGFPSIRTWFNYFSGEE